jgi:hypothetical protein
MDTLNPYPFQEEGIRWLCTGRPNAGRHNLHGILADEMGLGKTVQAIRAADQLEARKILILCQGIARDTWKREIEQWQLYDREVSIIRGSEKPRLTDVTICAYQTLRSLDVLTEIGVKHSWDILICDEAQAMKEPKSLTTQVVYGANFFMERSVGSRAEVVWLLTGTPLLNNPKEIWTHGMACFPSAVRDFENFNMWQNHFCVWKQTEHAKKVLAARNEAELWERFYPYILRRTQAQELPGLPELRWGHVNVRPDMVPRLPPELVEAQMVLNACLARLKNDPSPDEVQVILSAQTLHLASLLRWTGVVKARAVAESVMEDFSSGVKKMVLFARHTEVFETLQKEIPGSVVISGDTPQNRTRQFPEGKRQYLIDAFMGRVPGFEPRCLILSIDIAATSLTLTAAHHVGIIESGWVPAIMQQAVKRLHRIGQTEKVLARIYSLAGSIDEAVNEVILRKYLMTSRIHKSFERTKVA